ncbi:MAG: 2-oxo-4-hydroxy-4-carboxy-5-ureidoimidazoline decarboxylase [Xanthomonadales bacterium]|nr:2-oxo-4-hydroxy-4-carboxy-5-ureidoimidazoline decarboxylase [Xanthomonadales bacterium]
MNIHLNRLRPGMDHKDFLIKYGGIFEHSPWVAEAVFETGGGLLTDAETLGECFESVFLSADPVFQLRTLRAHPQLACALANPRDLTLDSANEQSDAGLDRCSTEELAEFSRLNADYNNKFGFPFIIAVRGLTRHEILDVFRQRLNNDRQSEFQTALRQTCQIAHLRLRDTHNG